MRRAVAFLTPIGGAAAPDPGTLAWFPVVGAALGFAVGGVWWLAGRWWPPAVAAVVAVAADLAVTGMLHIDGLVDSADGLLPPLEAGRRLEVMASPEVGAFGVATAVTVLLCRWAALASLRPAPLLLGALWTFSRTTMAATVRIQPYARGPVGGGLASAFVPSPGDPGRLALVGGAVGAVVLAAGWRAVAGPVALSAAAVAAAGVVLLARRRIGGFTGDVLGAAGVLAETAGLIVAAARW